MSQLVDHLNSHRIKPVGEWMEYQHGKNQDVIFHQDGCFVPRKKYFSPKTFLHNSKNFHPCANHNKYIYVKKKNLRPRINILYIRIVPVYSKTLRSYQMLLSISRCKTKPRQIFCLLKLILNSNTTDCENHQLWWKVIYGTLIMNKLPIDVKNSMSLRQLNSLALGMCGNKDTSITFKPIIQSSNLATRCEIAGRWMPQNYTNE